MMLGTKKAINARLDGLAKSILHHKRELLHAAEEGGMKGISAEEMKFAAAQMDVVLEKVEGLKEKIGKDEKDE